MINVRIDENTLLEMLMDRLWKLSSCENVLKKKGL